MHVNQVFWHQESKGATWEASHRCCTMRKAIHKKVAAGGGLNFLLDSDAYILHEISYVDIEPVLPYIYSRGDRTRVLPLRM